MYNFRDQSLAMNYFIGSKLASSRASSCPRFQCLLPRPRSSARSAQ